MRLTLANVKGLTTVLQAIKPGSKQVCSVIVNDDGLSIRWEDDSKTLQSSIYLKSELFAAYDAPQEQQVFGLQFSQLVDTLSTFACGSDASSLQLAYPGPDGELQLEMRDAPPTAGVQRVGGPALSMYARLSCLEQPVPQDMTEYWADPVSHFLTKGTILKEAIDDLEWPNGPVVLSMQRDPPRLSLKATGTSGALEVELPARELLSFSVASQQVSYTYAYRNLKAAFSNIPTHAKADTGSISTKVSIDASGLLKVTHMMSILGRGPGPGAPGASRAGPASLSLPGGSLMLTGQAGMHDPNRVGRVQFVSVPQLDDDDEDEGGAEQGARLGVGGS